MGILRRRVSASTATVALAVRDYILQSWHRHGRDRVARARYIAAGILLRQPVIQRIGLECSVRNRSVRAYIVVHQVAVRVVYSRFEKYVVKSGTCRHFSWQVLLSRYIGPAIRYTLVQLDEHVAHIVHPAYVLHRTTRDADVVDSIPVLHDGVVVVVAVDLITENDLE
jgi:hypothetical protein